MSAPDPAALFAEKTDAELLYLAQHAAHYPPAVSQAAVRELQRRGLVPTELPPPSRRPAPLAPPPPASTPGRPRAAVWGVLGLRPGYWVTPLLFWLNVLVFLAMVATGVDALRPASADLVRWGSNFSPLTLPAQPWRLLTSCFVHGGAGHLVLNMASLLFLGALTEHLFGSRRLLLGYLLSGLGGSLLSLWWHSAGVNSVGASGAIFGLYGLLVCTMARRPRAFSRPQRYTVLLFVLYLLVGSLEGGLQTATTDNAAHVGGLLVGSVLGVVLPPPGPQTVSAS